MHGQQNIKKCRVLFQHKFEKSVHLVGFIVRIYHDALSSERQMLARLSLQVPFHADFVSLSDMCLTHIRGNLMSVLCSKTQGVSLTVGSLGFGSAYEGRTLLCLQPPTLSGRDLNGTHQNKNNSGSSQVRPCNPAAKNSSNLLRCDVIKDSRLSSVLRCWRYDTLWRSCHTSRKITASLSSSIPLSMFLFSFLLYLRTPRSRLLLEKQTVSQLANKFPAFYGKRKVCFLL